MKYDEKKEKEQKYYNEQKERIELFMKYNVKGYRTIHFTAIEKNPMDGYDISGYINNDKKIAFTAGVRSLDDFQFDGNISSSAKLEVMYKNNPKPVSEIKKEQNKKEDK
ncbi:hypothetical protein SLGD_01833 [Staphylococcus lugdunensis HKU09-01]|nr:hypothetical protein SLGD_01833 [Staphylococcus lugdunensis HKU09-01]